MWIALEKKVPLIFWGEPSAEYTAYFSYEQAEEVDEKRFNRYVNLGISADDMFVRLGGSVDPRDLKPYTLPAAARSAGAELSLGVPRLVHAVGRQAQSQIIQQELGWQGDQVENVPPQYRYEKIECYMQGVRDYIKYIKRGYSRPSHLVALDVRNGRMTQERGPASDRASTRGAGRRASICSCEFIGLTEQEFLEVAMAHQVSPYVHDPAATQPGAQTADFSQWNREGAMVRVDAQQVIDRWRQRRGAGEQR